MGLNCVQPIEPISLPSCKSDPITILLFGPLWGFSSLEKLQIQCEKFPLEDNPLHEASSIHIVRGRAIP